MKNLKELERLFSKGVITRRQFIKHTSALGISVALSPMLLPKSGQAAVAKKGGRFRMGLEGGHTTDSLDAATLSDQVAAVTNCALRNALVEIDYKGNLIPELAESWDTSDAIHWIFNLRKGVEFHNGKTMTSEDIVYSIKYHTMEGSKSGAKGYLNQVQDIKTDGKDKVVFTLKSGNVDFPFILSDERLSIVPSGTSEREWEKGIGTGGYLLEEWEPGVRVFMKRNPNYWKTGRAHFEEITIVVIKDTNARTNALKTDQIDYMNRVDLKTVHILKKSPDIQILRAVSGFHNSLPMQTDVPPYDNNDVRLALKYATNREEIISKVLRGYGTVANDHPISPANRFYAADIPQRQYDPDKAKFHLKKAGLSSNTFDLYAANLGGFMDVSLLYSGYAKNAGININVIKKPDDGYWSDVWLKMPFCNSQWGARPTADMQFSVAYSGDAKWNDTHFKHKRFDELLLAARVELDDNKRREMYRECQMIVKDEGGAIVPFFKDIVEAANTKVKHEPLSGVWETDGHRAIERWWFA